MNVDSESSTRYHLKMGTSKFSLNASRIGGKVQKNEAGFLAFEVF